MNSLIRVETYSFDDTLFIDNGAYYTTMKTSIDILLRRVMGHDWMRKHCSSVYHRVSFLDKPKNEQWVCIMTADGTVVSMEPNTDEDFSDIVGRYYGYDECCLAAVKSDDFKIHKAFTAIGKSGFFPCKACAEKDRDQLIKEIQSRRLCSSAFPESRYMIDCVDMLHKILRGVIVLQTPEGSTQRFVESATA